MRALLVAGVLVLLGATGHVGAQEGSGPDGEAGQGGETLTWSVRPTPTEAEPDRPNFSYDVEVGQRVEDSVRVRNFGTEPLPLAIYASDALTASATALDLLPAGEEPSDVGVWIVLDSAAVEVPPRGFVDVPFTMVVPPGAEPGDHTGGVVTSYRAPGTDDRGDPVVLDRRLGTRVQVRVDGELRPALEITDLTVGYTGTAHPLGTGTLDVSYTATNTGNVRLGADQALTVPGRLGLPGRVVTLDPIEQLLPGDSLHLTTEVADVWPTLRASAELELDAVPIRDGDDFPDVSGATASASTWAVPWTVVIVLALLVVAPLWAWSRRRRRQRREASLVATAVQQVLSDRDRGPGADDAAGAGGSGSGTDDRPDRPMVHDKMS